MARSRTPRRAVAALRPGGRTRRAVAAAGFLAIAGVLVQGAVAAAQAVPVTGPLAAGPHLAALDLSADLFDRLAPLRPDFVRTALGDTPLSVLGPPPVRGSRGQLPTTVTTAPQSGPGTTATTVPLEPSTTTTTRSIIPISSGARLVITMAADHRTVKATDPITYTITVHNAGSRSFTGDVNITSHIPRGTTEETPAQCQGGSLPSKSNDVCQSVVTPVPGSSDPSVHQIAYSWSFTDTRPLGPGNKVNYTFRVTVDANVASGTVIENHAHMTIVGEPDQTTDTVRVTVQ